jgi:hypothetical protein
MLACSAHAEVANPTRPGGVYVSFEGGYHNSNTPGVATTTGNLAVTDGTPASSISIGGSGTTLHLTSAVLAGLEVGTPGFSLSASSGTESASVVVSPVGVDPTRFIAATEGGYGAATAGYALAAPLLGAVTRIEIYTSRNEAAADFGGIGAFALRSVDNRAAIAFVGMPIERVRYEATQDRSLAEYGLRLKADQSFGATTFAVSAEPFYMRYTERTVTSATTSVADWTARGESQVESDIFGIQAAVEGAVPVAGPLSLVGRGSAGIYSISADGDFASAFRIGSSAQYSAAIADDDTRTGYRVGGEAGVRWAFSEGAWASLLGSLDYLSEMPTAALPRAGADAPAHIAFDDMLDWRLGLRLTFSTP